MHNLITTVIHGWIKMFEISEWWIVAMVDQWCSVAIVTWCYTSLFAFYFSYSSWTGTACTRPSFGEKLACGQVLSCGTRRCIRAVQTYFGWLKIYSNKFGASKICLNGSDWVPGTTCPYCKLQKDRLSFGWQSHNQTIYIFVSHFYRVYTFWFSRVSVNVVEINHFNM